MTDVYVLLFSNGKRYVGCSKRGHATRIEEHADYARLGLDHPLYDAWRELGHPNIERVESFDDHRAALDRELVLINELKSTVFDNGYNVRANDPRSNDRLRLKMEKWWSCDDWVSSRASSWTSEERRKAQSDLMSRLNSENNNHFRAAAVSSDRIKNDPEHRERATANMRAGRRKQLAENPEKLEALKERARAQAKKANEARWRKHRENQV